MYADFFDKNKKGLTYFYGVFFALGISCFFGIGFVPFYIVPVGFTLFFFLTSKIFNPFTFCRYLCVALACFWAGLGLISARTTYLKTPLLYHTLQRKITGTVLTQEKTPTHQRVVLELKNHSLFSIKKIRVNVDASTPLSPGDTVWAKAFLTPLPKPAKIGAHNLARELWYQGIGASGQLKEIYQITPKDGFSSFLGGLRQTIIRHILMAQAPEEAAITGALITGSSAPIPLGLRQAYRAAGISHVLAVSGFHLTLLSGLIFILLQGIFALFSTFQQRHATYKISALGALGGTFFYLLLSGCHLPALRAFFMITFVLVGITLNKKPLSLRTAVLAACFLLCLTPESLLTPGFQLSFMAVFALLSFYETFKKRLNSPLKKMNRYQMIRLTLYGILIIDAVAFITTSFYSIYHFHHFNPYGVLGNFCTSFLFSLVIMPCLLFGVLLMPLGLDYPLFKITGWVLYGIKKICQSIEHLPYADIPIAAFDPIALWLVTLGFLTLFFFQTRVRLTGILLIVIGLCGHLWYKQPALILTDRGIIGAYAKDWRFKNPQKSLYQVNIWQEYSGHIPKHADKKVFDPNYLFIGPYKVAFNDYDCTDSVVNILPDTIPECPGITITKSDLKNAGLIELYSCRQGLCLKTLKESLGKYPWNF